MARVSREAAAAHRAAMVAAASRLVRARGVDGVRVAEVTREAGLTHGGFYGHFADKTALVEEALAAAFDEGRGRLEEVGLEGYLRAYLSRSHRDHPESGCPIPALAAEIDHGDAATRSAFAEGVAALVAAIAARLPDADPEARAGRAAALAALLVGGLTLARAQAATDLDASDRLLRSLRRRALAMAAEP